MREKSAVHLAKLRRPRAERYDIHTVIFYRARGERRWHEGVIKNVSASGVLLRAEQSVGPGTALEMRFVLPVELAGEGGAQVACRGVVVRASLSSIAPQKVFVASTIEYARLIHNSLM